MLWYTVLEIHAVESELNLRTKIAAHASLNIAFSILRYGMLEQGFM